MRKLLPLIGNPHGSGRSALTCRYRCGDACFREVPHASGDEYVGDATARAHSRRSMLRSAATAVAPSTDERVTVPEGHDQNVVIR